MTDRLQNLYKSGKILYGGDYNPEQWLDRPDILAEDIRLMKRAHINVATLGVFSWSMLEPEEGRYQFGWLEEVVDRLYQNGIYTVLATPSGAKPVWIDEKYPEALRVDEHGQRRLHGFRHNHCMTSPAYRRKTAEIDTQLARRFGGRPGLLLWHVSNEFGGECYCPLCRKKFQDYLADKFGGDIEKLNRAWWTTFWSHRYQNFSQVEPPVPHGETSVMGLSLEWRRFTTFNTTDFMKSEIEVLRRETPDIPVTTNFMTLFDGLDYRETAKELDIVSWDNYPRYHNDSESDYDTALESAFHHAVFRGMKREQPFMLMESAPGLVNWHGFNKMQRPGMHSLMALQAVACGADSAMYFQWRKGRGSFEQYHGAVIGHLGRDDTRIYQEAVAAGAMLEKLSDVRGSLVRAKAALLFDWDNRWAVRDMRGLAQSTKQYEKVCLEQYRILYRMGLETDIVSRDDDLSRYALVAAPMLYLLGDGTAANLKKYVEQGGQLVATYLTGYVNRDTLCYLGGFPGDGLQDLFGLYAEEIDALYPADRNYAVFADGSSFEIRDYEELVRVRDAETEARYKSDYVADSPAVTSRAFGKGRAWYVAARLENAGMAKIYQSCLNRAGVTAAPLPENLEYHCREKDGVSYDFYLNHGTAPLSVPAVSGENLLTGEKVRNAVTLAPRSGAVIRRDAIPR